MLLGEQIEEALSLSADLGIPDALGHLDLNPGNVIVSEGQCVFLDWAEAYVGNPLFSFQYLVEHFRRMAGVDATAESGLTSAYCRGVAVIGLARKPAGSLGSCTDAGGLCLCGRDRCVGRPGQTSRPQGCRISTEFDAADASRSKPIEGPVAVAHVKWRFLAMSIIVLRAYVKLIQFDLYLARGNFAALYDKVHRHPLGNKAASANAIEQICSAVDMACIWYWKEALCLQRSAATTCLLKRYGVPAQMVIGAQQIPFKAHAWVEVNGAVINDKSYTREMYAVLDRC